MKFTKYVLPLTTLSRRSYGTIFLTLLCTKYSMIPYQQQHFVPLLYSPAGDSNCLFTKLR